MEQAAGATTSPPKDRIRAASRGNGGVNFPVLTKKRARPDAAGNKTTSPDKAVRLPKVSATSAKVTYSSKVPSTDNGEELEVVKCILVREGYLQRLTRASADGQISGAHLGQTVDLLDLLRVATLECVEAIAAWRKKSQREQRAKASTNDVAPYLWNGVNYILKIPSDLEFLGKHSALVQWLGFSLERNPFVLPINLDCRVKLSGGGAVSPERTPLSCVDDSSRFIEVGGKRAPEHPRVNTAEAAAALALAERKRAKNPYETRVINDDELVPTASASPIATGLTTKEGARPSTRNQRRQQAVLPSQIGDLDMMRIEDAEVVVLAEEACFGQLARDWQGRIVPAAEARRQANMIEMSGGVYITRDVKTSSSPHGSPPDEDTRNEPETLSAAKMKAAGSMLNGKFITRKNAGILGTITKPTTPFATKSQRSTGLPSHNNRGGQLSLRSKTHGQSRSRGAQYEDTLEVERRALNHFESVMEALREQIEQKDMDVAYFESIPGLQLLGNELEALVTASRAESATLRQELIEKKAIWDRKRENIERKHDIIAAYKVEQKTAIDKRHQTEIEDTKAKATKRETQSHYIQLEVSPIEKLADSEHQLAAPAVKHLCATLIQAQARGMLARAAFVRMKVAFVVASTFIQAGARGFLVRRRVARLFWERTAIIELQRVARGMLSRHRVRTKRLALRSEKSACDIQRIVRGRHGRIRMRKIRHLFAARSNLAASVTESGPISLIITATDLKELARSCADMITIPSLTKSVSNSVAQPLSALVLGIVRVLMLFTSDSDDEWDIPNVRWREAARFLNGSTSLLRRMRKISLAANDAKRHLRASSLGCALLEMLAKDRFFHFEHFEAIPRGAHAACVIFRWILAYGEVAKLQHVLPDGDNECLVAINDISEDECKVAFFVVSMALSKSERAQEQAEKKENIINEDAAARHFVPVELLRSTKVSTSSSGGVNCLRKRAVILLVASDMPTRAKQNILNRLMATLPGRFVVINSSNSDVKFANKLNMLGMTRERQISVEETIGHTTDTSASPLMFDISAIRSAISLGFCVVLEADVGLRDPCRRRFINAFAAVKAAVYPSPHCILLQGSLKNRPEELGSRTDSTVNEQGSVMVDGELKHAMENASQHLFVLSQPQIAIEMGAASNASDDPTFITQPPLALVLVMEAVIVLLTPGKAYAGPNMSSTVVSWRLARRLLGNPRFLQLKLAAVRADSVPVDNLIALDRYLSHPAWPSRHHALSQQSFVLATTNEQNEDLGSAHLLNALSQWVESIVSLSHLISDGNGIATPITRSRPVLGLFGNVITYSNAGETHGVAATQGPSDEPEPKLIPHDWIAEGEDLVVRELLDAVLADVCVYRTACELDGGVRCIVSVFRDCGLFFFSAYAPGSSQHWTTTISETQVEMLLAPNSLERVDSKRPPATLRELCDRLVRLCVVQNGAYPDDSATRARALEMSSLVHSSAQLVIRPRAIRLLRRTLCAGGIMATVTLAELSRGRVRVEAFIHSNDAIRNVCTDDQRQFVCPNIAGAVCTTVGLESILERMSAKQASQIPAYSPPLLANMVLDRLHLYHSIQSRTKRFENNGRMVPLCIAHQLLVLVDSGEMSTKICVRAKETSPGRSLMRRAVRLPSEAYEGGEYKKTTDLWMLAIVEMHVRGTFAAHLYHPGSSRRLSAELSSYDLRDFVRVSRFTSQSQLHHIVKRVFRFKFSPSTEPEDEDDMSGSDSEINDKFASKAAKNVEVDATTDRQVVTGLDVNRILARFPAAIPHTPEKYQQVATIHRRVRVYVQVESQVLDRNASHRLEKQPERGLLVRVFVPETCEEHEVAIRDSEIETWLEENQSWATLRTNERAWMSQKLVKTTFEWCNQNSISRVSARLPSGAIFSYRSRTQQPRNIEDEAQHTGSNQSDESNHAQVAPSCIVLLDDDEPELEEIVIGGDKVVRHLSKWCLHYDREELVYRGTHRANGELLVVQVYMKAVIRERLVPLVPIDRIVHEDSIVTSFQCYHPLSSSHTTVVVDGRRDLREVVGPDKANLIASSHIRELLRHIIEARMEVELVDTNEEPTQLPPPSSTTIIREYREREQHKRRRSLKIVFARDRLFAKQKVTPISAAFETDALINAVKLIDRSSERGVKVLSRAKVLSGFGRVIFTFFSVTISNSQRWRLDAYVSSTSERLSLVLESADLVHVVGDRTELLLKSAESDDDEIDQLDVNELRKQQRDYQCELALLIVDHVGIEQKRDGRCSRLYLSEYYVPTPASIPPPKEAKERRSLLFKAVRSVDTSQIIIAIYLVAQLAVVDLYEPSTGLKCSLELSLCSIGAVFGVPEPLALDLLRSESDSPSIIGRSSLMIHLSSFLHITKEKHNDHSEWHQRHDDGVSPSVHATLCFDQKQGLEMMDLFSNHRGCCSDTTKRILDRVNLSACTIQQWVGPVSTVDGQYVSLHFSMVLIDGKVQLLVSAYSPSVMVVVTTFIGPDHLRRLVSDKWGESLPTNPGRGALELLLQLASSLRFELVEDTETVELVEYDHSGRRWSMLIHEQDHK